MSHRWIHDQNFHLLIRAIGIIQVADDVLQNLIVDVQGLGERIGQPGLTFLIGKMEQPGVITRVRLFEQLA